MTAKGFLMVFAAGAMSLGFATAAMADMGPVEARQACMKANGKMMGVMVPVIKGEKPYDKAANDAVIAEVEAACAGWNDSFGEDTKPGVSTVETWSKEEIWTDMAGFQAAGAAWFKAKEAIKATADEASFKGAFPALGASCQSCHEKFRRPKG